MEKLSYIDLLVKYGIQGAHPGGFTLTHLILRNLPVNRTTRVLDVGAGTGQTSAYIAKTYRCKVVAVDINEKMLEKAKERFKRERLDVELLKGDATSLQFGGNSFDIVLSESVTAFTHAPSALKEYSRVLKKGGVLAAIEITARTAFNEKDLWNIRQVYGINQVYTLEEWLNMLTEAGFGNIVTEEVKTMPTNRFTSLKMIRDFLPHLNITRYYHKKLSYRIFLCKKH